MKKIVAILSVIALTFSACDEDVVPYEIPTKGLVARYSFSSGNANDLSGNGNNGIISGVTSSSDRFKVASESFNFNSNDDYIKVSNPSFVTNKQGTFVAWVKFTSLDHVQYLASVGDENSAESYISLIRLDADTKTLGIYQRESGNANWINGTTVIQADKYYHVVMQSNGSEWSIYLDGKKEQLNIKSGINNGKWIGHLTSIDNFVIGSSIILPPYTIPFLSGTIDDVLMYDRVLSENEVELLYNGTK